MRFILANSIEILRALSSSALKESINLINEHLDQGGGSGLLLSNVEVELVNGEIIDLSRMPDYSEMISDLEQIQIQITNE